MAYNQPMEIKGDTVRLSTGREFGIERTFGALSALGAFLEGFDPTIYPDPTLTDEEFQEIADYMIGEWTRWATERPSR